MSTKPLGEPITVGELRQIQRALVESCQLYKRKEDAEVLTKREYNLWQECLEEHDKISEEIQRIQEEEKSWVLVEEPWTLVEKEEKDTN